MPKYILILFCFALIFQSPSVWAQPKPQNKKEVLGDLNQRIEDYKQDEKSLKRDTVDAEKEYKNTQKELVKISASVQKNERELYTIEKRLDTLRTDQKRIKSELEEEREALAKTITALERIRRTPPQAMIARPAAPIDTARGAMLLQKVLPVLDEKAQELKKKSEQYAANEEELKQKQQKLVSLSEELEGKEKKLKGLVAERKATYAKLNSDLASRQKEIKAVSQQAQNLADLVKRLEDERTRNAQRQAQKAKETNKPIKQASLPKIGKSQLPLQGPIQTKYNQKDSFGANSKGVSIEGRGGSLIVSPMGGIVRFAGYFKNYGNMVIIEHENGYHSLIAGLEKIDTVVDQSVSAGEPLGNLYHSENGKPPTLYFELRHKGKAIDPSRKFTELG